METKYGLGNVKGGKSVGLRMEWLLVDGFDGVAGC